MRIGIVGAGMAGLSCARELGRLGHSCVLFDKGRGPGGRMSTRRIVTPLGEASFDHGAQYLTARDPAFLAQVGEWADAGHLAPWPPAGPDAWVGTPTMNAPIAVMAKNCDVRWDTRVDAIVHDGGWRIGDEEFDAVVVSVPAEQVPALVEAHDGSLADIARSAASDPCWTVMAAFAEPVPTEGDRLTRHGMIGSAVCNSAKPGRAGPEAWVLQADADWSRDHLEDEAEVVERALLAKFVEHVGADPASVVATRAHRWRYAKAGGLDRGPFWNAELGLGACGDWLLAPRVEAAWLTGRKLAALIAEERTDGG